MFNLNSYRGARRLLEVCGRLRKDETVAIVTDTTKSELAALIAGQAATLGADPTILTMTPRLVDGSEPTNLIAEAMVTADLVILAATYSLAHARATRNVLENGGRVVSVSNVTEELLSVGGLFADFEALRPTCQRLADIFSQGSKIHVCNPAGTDITLSTVGRQGNSHHCIADEPGMFTAVPNIEANIAPVEGTASGQIVFDGSIPNFGIGVLVGPVQLEVVEGMVVDVSGGAQARLLSRLWEEQRDPAVYNVAQVAVGLNPKCRNLTGQITNDHGVLGTMHFGIGTSSNLGGHTQAAMHMDGILWTPTITVDDQEIIKDGRPTGDWGEALNEYLSANGG